MQIMDNEKTAVLKRNHSDDQANKKPRGKMMMLEDKSEKQQMPLFDPLDLELQAMNAIYNALKPLDNGCRKRVMDWVAHRVIYVS
jgi:hypothetical protein